MFPPPNLQENKERKKKWGKRTLVKRQTRRLIHFRRGTVPNCNQPKHGRAQRRPPRRRRCSPFPRSASSRHPQRALSSDHQQSAALRPTRYLSAVSEWRYRQEWLRSVNTNSFAGLDGRWYHRKIGSPLIFPNWRFEKLRKVQENVKCRSCLPKEKKPNLLKVQKKYSFCVFKGCKLTGRRLFLISVSHTNTHGSNYPISTFAGKLISHRLPL